MSNATGTVRISREVLRKILESALGATIPEDAEVVIGGPEMDYAEGELRLGYAWDNDDSSPIEWVTGKPHWLGDGK